MAKMPRGSLDGCEYRSYFDRHQSVEILERGRLISYGVVSGAVDGFVPTTLTPLLYDPAPSQVLTGFNLTIWFEHRLAEVVASLQRLVGWIASGHLRTPAVSSMPLGDAAEAHRLLETGATMGKVVFKP
jgi:NADPH2:quinone reductase